MENGKNKLTPILDSEMFDNGREQYYFDMKRTVNQKMYLRITNRRPQNDLTYKRSQVVFFEEDLPFLVEAITMLLGRAASSNLGISC